MAIRTTCRGRLRLLAALVPAFLVASTTAGLAPAASAADGVSSVDSPLAAATSGTPHFSTEIERDVYDAINLQRTERGLPALALDVTTDGSLPTAEKRWRDCLINANIAGMSAGTGLTHDQAGSCRTDPNYPYSTEQVIAVSAHGNSSASSPVRGPDAYSTVSAWQTSPPHMEWLMARDANAIRVYAACVTTSTTTYLLIAATLLDGEGTWPTPNRSYSRAALRGSDGSTDSPFDAANYSACDRTGGASPVLGAGSSARSMWRTASTRNPSVTGLSINEPWAWSPFQISRLYAAYFKRAPDSSGLSYWMNASTYDRVSNRTVSLSEISQYFTQSDEFRLTYGNALSNEAFVDLVYRNVLGRSADAAGRSYWLNLMSNGLTRGDVMVWFSEGDEYIAQTGQAVAGGCWNAGDAKTSYLCAASYVPVID